MVDYLHRPVAHEAFFKKYASKKFLKGRLLDSYLLRIKTLNLVVASILTRQWAKKYHPLYLDSTPSGKDGSKSIYAKDVKGR